MKDLALCRSASALLASFRFTFVIIIVVSGKFRDAYTSGDGGFTTAGKFVDLGCDL